jgi:hypothetical protein
MAWMESLNDHKAWEGKIENIIVASIRDSNAPLVNLTG